MCRAYMKCYGQNFPPLYTCDNNGKVWFLGKDAPVKATAGGGETGAAKSDANRYNIELTDESLDYPYELDAASVTAIKSIDYPEN